MTSTLSDRVGWTKAEYDAAPRMAERLHSRILDLEDENAYLRGELQRIVDHKECVHWPEKGCAHAMRALAVVALGGSVGEA